MFMFFKSKKIIDKLAGKIAEGLHNIHVIKQSHIKVNESK